MTSAHVNERSHHRDSHSTAIQDASAAVEVESSVHSWMVPVPGLVYGTEPVRRGRDEAADPLGGSRVSAEMNGALTRLRGAGQALPAEISQSMGAAMGADLSQVRIHTGAEPARLAQSVQAAAFTQGSDIYFGAGNYAPQSQSGRQLLAHELAHTVQQDGGGGSGGGPLIGRAADPAEAQADQVASRVIRSLQRSARERE